MMEPRVKFIKLKDSIVVSYGRYTSTVHVTDPRYNRILGAINENNLELIPKIMSEGDSREVKKLLKF